MQTSFNPRASATHPADQQVCNVFVDGGDSPIVARFLSDLDNGADWIDEQGDRVRKRPDCKGKQLYWESLS